jgi:hypothetical protein
LGAQFGRILLLDLLDRLLMANLGQFGRILLFFLLAVEQELRHAKVLNVTLGGNVAVGADTPSDNEPPLYCFIV